MFAFVYGTLKKGEPNNYWLTNISNGSANFIGTGVTQTKYPLVIASRYNIPFLLDQPGTGKNVQGEVYEIDEKMKANLDILEEYPNLYSRRIEPILLLLAGNNSAETGRIKEAWTYFLSDFKPDLLRSPYLDCYSSNGSHKLPYVTSYVHDMAVDHRADVKNVID